MGLKFELYTNYTDGYEITRCNQCNPLKMNSWKSELRKPILQIP
jgi:hypothetical protein